MKFSAQKRVMFVPPFPKPLPDRRVGVAATSKGLVLIPSNASRSILIRWGRNGGISTVPFNEQPTLHVHGVVGIQHLFNKSYIFLITGRKKVGRYMDKGEVHCCTSVIAVPLEQACAQIELEQAASDQQADESLGQTQEVDDVQTPAAIKSKPLEDTVDVPAGPEVSAEKSYTAARQTELEEKVVRETSKHFSRGEFWFTYDFDLTTPLERSRGSNLPLWRRVDRRFWHNEHLSTKLVEAEAHSLILPLMQGYVQISELAGSQVILISRRSKERAGLRYQRRGIDGQGKVANYVETEQILHLPQLSTTYSFLQFRGSIPLFWSQSPFSLKPPPVLQGNESENLDAAKLHFDKQVDMYGFLVCINLAEQGGKEGEISKTYKSTVEKLANPQVRYMDFDFHKECAGMKFENVQKLTEQMKETMEEMGYWCSKEGKVVKMQKGSFRVSCLDCLDRTNVVQSAFGRTVLMRQLEEAGVELE